VAPQQLAKNSENVQLTPFAKLNMIHKNWTSRSAAMKVAGFGCP